MGIIPGNLTFSPAQIQFFNNSNKYINIASGAVRSGKTFIFNFRWYQHLIDAGPGDYLMMGNSVSSLERNVLYTPGGFLDILETARKAGHVPYKYITSGAHSGRQIQWGTGNEKRVIYIVGGGDKGAISTIQGMTALGVYMDEAATYPIDVVNMAKTRCSLPQSKMFLNCNPQGPMHPLKTDYIDAKDMEQDTYIQTFTIDDNLFLTDTVKDRYKRGYKGAFYRRNILGEWAIATGIVYDNFDISTHVKSIGEIHEIIPQGKTYIGIDFGMYNPTVFLKIKVDTNPRDPKFAVIDEYYFANKDSPCKNINDFYMDLLKFIGNEKIHGIFIDPSSKVLRTLFNKKLLSITRSGSNAVNNGIASVHYYISTGSYLVAEHCIHHIKEAGSYSWDDEAQKLGRDAVIKQEDHTWDAARYVVHSLFPLRAGR